MSRSLLPWFIFLSFAFSINTLDRSGNASNNNETIFGRRCGAKDLLAKENISLELTVTFGNFTFRGFAFLRAFFLIAILLWFSLLK